MFRCPMELEAIGRYRIVQVAEERQRCALIDQATAGLPSPLTQLRRRLGLGLVQTGKIIAGLETLQMLPTPQAWAGPARR